VEVDDPFEKLDMKLKSMKGRNGIQVIHPNCADVRTGRQTAIKCHSGMDY